MVEVGLLIVIEFIAIEIVVLKVILSSANDTDRGLVRHAEYFPKISRCDPELSDVRVFKIAHEHTSIVASPHIIVGHVSALMGLDELLVRLLAGEVLRLNISDGKVFKLLRDLDHVGNEASSLGKFMDELVLLVILVLLHILDNLIEILRLGFVFLCGRGKHGGIPRVLLEVITNFIDLDTRLSFHIVTSLTL